MNAAEPKRVLAAGVVVLDERRILLIQRGQEPEKGRWTLPGGRLEPGETLPQTAAREALEETGLTVEIGEELGRLDIPYGDDVVYEVHDFSATVVAVVAPSGNTVASTVPVAGDDAADIRWFELDELRPDFVTHDLLRYLHEYGVL